MDGQLPAGLSFQDDGSGTNTARIIGTPTESGTFTFTLACDNFANGIESRSYTLSVGELDAASERVQALSKELETAKAELTQLQKQQAESQKQQNELQKQLTESQKQQAQLQKENAKLASKIEKTNTKIKEIQAQLPQQVIINTKTVSAKKVKAALRKANNPYATTITLGASVSTVKKGAFAGTDVRTIMVKTKKLTTKRVSGALKGSSVKTVKVKVKASTKKLKQIRKTYKSAFAKKNTGRMVTLTFVS